MKSSTVFKEFPNANLSISRFNKNEDWKLQFLEWDISLDDITLSDSSNRFRDANTVIDTYSKRSIEYNNAGIVNILYDNIFTYSGCMVLLSCGIVYGIL